MLCLVLCAASWAAAQNLPVPETKLPPPPGTQQSQQHRPGAIHRTVDMVVLRITVSDRHGQFVSNLSKNDFRVFEDKAPQQISVFSHQDVPVSVGLVIDNSGSMREKRAQVNTAALTFVQTSNPQDEEFVVNFNDEYYLDTTGDFTNNAKDLNDALSRIDSRGSTALYDALIGSLDHLKKGHKDKKVILLVTDGDDDASRSTLDQAMKAAGKSNAVIYAIGVFSEDDRKNDKGMIRRSKRVLKELADVTGGEAFFPKDLDQVKPICEQVAHDIRNQYTIGYYPSNTAKDGTFRTIKVEVTGPKSEGKLSVRTRTGYYAQSAAPEVQPSSGN
ncbi:MAG TPA: VWA domain-containing protein [Candidatus Acidoferrales bacterium]|nr:VWA domain-containing protein [Candidatus Acidoferrales bacterium]